MDVKPICVIYYLPEIMSPPSGKMYSVYEVNEMFRNIFTDYFTFAIPSHLSADGSCEDVRLEVFHPKDFTPIQFKELEKLIKEAVDNLLK